MNDDGIAGKNRKDDRSRFERLNIVATILLAGGCLPILICGFLHDLTKTLETKICATGRLLCS